MTTQNLGLMKAINAKMGYLNHRQRIIADNIANADTPGYKPKDVSKIDFSSVLDKVDAQQGGMNVSIGRTDSAHMTISGGSNLDDPKAKEQKKGLYEVSPTGNAVIMEQQLIKSNEVVVDHNFMSGLYKKQLTMMRVVLAK